MTEMETVGAELWAMGLSVGKHPTEFVRAELHAQGVVTAADLRDLADRSVVEVAGVVTHRQQPSTAKGTVFLNLEDETGLVNVICAKGVWKRFRTVARAPGAARAWRARKAPRRDQPRRRPDHPPADQPRRRTALPRLPLTRPLYSRRRSSTGGEWHESFRYGVPFFLPTVGRIFGAVVACALTLHETRWM